ncbi:MAG TPA: helical backbone metal receptor [candidate division Zixibacteria bacterium]|nr:helical backbone metal receptor [candidate division Zixibacteria bacterium]
MASGTSKFSMLANSGRVLRSAVFIALLCASLHVFAARVLTDETGRRVTVPDHVGKVVALTPAIANTICAIGGESQLAAVTAYTQFPEQARNKPSIGDIMHPSLERIAAIHPDLVIAMSTLNSPETVRGLERIGIQVYLVTGQDLAGLYRSITSIGQVLGREREAQALSQQLHAREQRIREQAKAGGAGPRVLLLLSIDPCITAGRTAFLTEMITAAGARSVTDDVKQDWIRMSVESLVARNPDYLLTLMDAPFSVNELKSRPGWSQLEAVRRGHVLRIDDRLQVPAPVAFDGLEEFARQLRAAGGGK